MCAHALVHALNDAKTHAQQGCAMQFSGITLNRLAKLIVCKNQVIMQMMDVLQLLAELAKIR